MLIQRLKDSYKITAGTGAAYLKPQEVKIQREDDSEFVIDAPGEYDISQIYVENLEFRIQDLEDGTQDEGSQAKAVILESEGFTVVYIPKPPKKFDEDDLKVYEHVDVLMVPGKRGDLVTQLAPPLVIPLDKPEEMAKSLGIEVPEEESSLKLRSASDLPEDTEMVRLG